MAKMSKTQRRRKIILQRICKHPSKKAFPVEGCGWVCGVCGAHLTGD